MNHSETETARVTVLTVPDCPNAPLIRERITEALHGRVVPVEWIEVHDADEAVRQGMSGSPTLLLDGADPFAEEGLQTGLSCRLYRHADGTTEGAPAAADLRRVLAESGVLP
ncbi:thioredoxin family protein [Streptomyces sp. ISL-99]|uniref:thioredoxin family protein n=1 Tax=Streptomyces sp. ISL-99 TaxID=2819193 RepID=UPI001BE73091|nr:thioredoxin family protein [Streptomyces sp. ISL-99]MBT2529787.1 thioredoxin family protein [Streptomyces sp. ISL-99]